MILKLDLHTHTGRYSSCARHSPRELCQTAIACGLDALAITEHHQQWTPAEIAELQARFPALKLYAGVELTCTDGHDYVVLGLEPGHYAPNPMPYAQMQSLIEARRRAGGAPFAFLAHAFRFSADEAGLETCAVEGIEMASPNMLDRGRRARGEVSIARAELYQRWQEKRGWISLYNSDAHSRRMVGTFYNLVELPEGALPEPPPDEEALIRLLRAAQIRPYLDEKRLRARFRRRGLF